MTITIRVNSLIPTDLDRLNQLISRQKKDFGGVNWEHIAFIQQHHLLISLHSLSKTPRDRGNLIGFATLLIIPTLSNLFGIIHDVIIEQEHRGKGYGRMLMAALHTSARRAKLSYVDLNNTPEPIDVENFPDKFGYTVVKQDLYRFPIQ